MSFEVGQKVGDYQIVGTLGAGGMGKVYKVKNLISDREDAMKVLLPNLADDPELADRFIREIKVLASLDHPNIAGLRTAFRLENQLLMIMEFVEGSTLEERIKNTPLPVNEAIDYILQVLSALAYAHEHGVVHRDIKPANMMLTPRGVVKLMDFGIARSKTERQLTLAGATLGSLFYMSPEQVQAGELDGRSDLYSVGVSLYELVTGDRPFKGNSDYDLMVAQLRQMPVAPIERRPELPKSLNDAILIAMAKDPAKRFQSAEAFAGALGQVREESGKTPTVIADTAPRASTAPYSATGVMNALPTPPVAAPQPPLAVAQPPQAGPVTDQRPMVQPPPATTGPKSYRGLYMTLGALVALGVIVLAATLIPRVLKTRAGGQQPAAQSAPSGATPTTPPTAPSTPAPAEGAGIPSGNNQIAAPAESGASSNAAATPAAPGAPQAGAPGPAAVAPGSLLNSAAVKNVAKKGSQAANRAAAASAVNPAAGSNSPPSAAQNPGPAQVETAPAAAASQADLAKAKALDELRDRMIGQGARASAVGESVDNLRQQQRAQGLGLRSDISASLSRMQQYMNQADAAINRGDPESGRKYADLAEREIENLEKFLGR
jgi:serine/threonine-protein kinase